ncbi:MerR family transcriptional regulator [Corynebacterium freiburgense]|uniref:helix-turn-helix domain-containing protein n=1 Tax=Corynebacterium freiburgense TaxID=556548 RepID=UPI00047BB9B9|nr:MerR family transcriptional regulator [Corynebacterium freiburgense]WJZ02416.1 Nodulation protein NolA [Corynebacterium freiburgense]
MTLSISEVAAFAQVTVRTVRHYHHIGLMPEPKRDSLDRRVYEPEDALRLARIRTLVDSGFTLPDILEVMHEHTIDGEAFEQVRHRVAQRLDAELEAIIEQQHNLHAIENAANIGISQNVQKIVAEMEKIVDNPQAVEIIRDIWHATSVLFPEELMGEVTAQELKFLKNQEYRYWYKQYMDLWDAEIDDPRVEEVVQGTIEFTKMNLDEFNPDDSLYTEAPRILEFMLDRLPPVLVHINNRVKEALEL